MGLTFTNLQFSRQGRSIADVDRPFAVVVKDTNFRWQHIKETPYIYKQSDGVNLVVSVNGEKLAGVPFVTALRTIKDAPFPKTLCLRRTTRCAPEIVELDSSDSECAEIEPPAKRRREGKPMEENENDDDFEVVETCAESIHKIGAVVSCVFGKGIVRSRYEWKKNYTRNESDPLRRIFRNRRCIGYQLTLDRGDHSAFVQKHATIDIGDVRITQYRPRYNRKLLLSITEYDCGRLSPGEYLNDAVVQFYLRYASVSFQQVAC